MAKRIMPACLMAVVVAAASVAGAQAGPMATLENLKAPDGHVRLLSMFATGVQVYVCAARAEQPDAFAWTFTAPEAELWNDLGEKVGTHYGGPTWKGNDGSTVVGEVVERAEAPAAGAIPWLLLKAKSNDGAGVFGAITYIQRLDTAGGVAPTDGCDRTTVGTTRAVPYTANYAFYYAAAR